MDVTEVAQEATWKGVGSELHERLRVRVHVVGRPPSLNFATNAATRPQPMDAQQSDQRVRWTGFGVVVAPADPVAIQSVEDRSVRRSIEAFR